MTVDQGSGTAGRDDRDEGAAALTASILTTVERQLSRYLTAITQRVDAALEAQTVAAEAYQHALQRALDERLAEVATHNTTRLNEFGVRLTTLNAQPAGVSPEDLLQIRQSMREDIWRSLAPVTERLDALADANRRTDDQASALVQHLNSSTAGLVARIEEGDRRVAADAAEKLMNASAGVTARVDGVEAVANRVAATLEQRVAAVEAAAREQIAALETSVAARDERTGAAVAAAVDRVSDLEERLSAASLQLATIATKVAGIDEDAIEDVKARMSAAVGEAMLVRIELDRAVATMDEKLDRTSVRLVEIEAMVTDEMDVGAAVQLERLDELERAVLLLDPDQFVRRDEVAPHEASSAESRTGAAHRSAREPGPCIVDIEPHATYGPEADDGSLTDTHHDMRSCDEYSSLQAWS